MALTKTRNMLPLLSEHSGASTKNRMSAKRPLVSFWQRLLPQWLTNDTQIVDQHIREGRFQRSFALLISVSGLFTGLEVAYEHLKGSYNQRIMYTPLLLSFALFVAGLWAAFSTWAARVVLRLVSIVTLLDGLTGFYFHIRGIQRKPGGWRIPVFNLVMGPPITAPLLFASIGALGIIASFVRRENAPQFVTSVGTPEATPL